MSINRTGTIFDDSDEEDDEGGFSPPKTIQFHIPQSKLLQTPGRFTTIHAAMFPLKSVSSRSQQAYR
jgi:hypothetical protein